MDSSQLKEIEAALIKAKDAAKTYRRLTGKPLGITGEIAEFEAARILGLELSAARQAGFDAIQRSGDKVLRVQIKGRRLPSDAKVGQRIGRIRLNHAWDKVVLVLLDEDFQPVEIHEADRALVKEALELPGSISRNKRGALAVSKFKSIGKLLWSRDGVYAA